MEIKIRDNNRVSRRIDAGKMSRIGARHTFKGKAVDELPRQVDYEADIKYPNFIRID